MTAITVPEAGRRGTSSLPGRRAVSQGVVLCTQMLGVGMVLANLGMICAAGVSWRVAGPAAALSAAAAGVLVIVFFATGQAVQLIGAQLADGTGMAVVMLSYLLRVTGLAGVLGLAMAHQERLSEVFVPGSFLAGAVLALLGWLAGVVTTGARQRVYIYDRDYDAASQQGGQG